MEQWKNNMTTRGKIIVGIVLALVLFAAGRGAALLAEEWQETYAVVPASSNWGLGFGETGTQPTGNVSAEELKKYNAYFVGSDKEKKIYLTFDCGYENGNTEAILA
ncbi:MAG: delta-lactam-biosynthetic de-N-acetylase, partial [Lachnospiraceae bacterium]|nr:delta-lactam-biosynthetic de-N-acetylase [Lachnospiraceae bacterium]